MGVEKECARGRAGAQGRGCARCVRGLEDAGVAGGAAEGDEGGREDGREQSWRSATATARRRPKQTPRDADAERVRVATEPARAQATNNSGYEHGTNTIRTQYEQGTNEGEHRASVCNHVLEHEGRWRRGLEGVAVFESNSTGSPRRLLFSLARAPSIARAIAKGHLNSPTC